LAPGEREEALNRYATWIKKFKMDDNEDSLIEWDRTENKKQLLDWDPERNLQRGLWIQAHNILASRRHHIFAVFTGPDVWKNEKGNYEYVNEMTPKDIDSIIASWVTLVEGAYGRCRDAGAKYPQIMKAFEAAIAKGEKSWQAKQQAKQDKLKAELKK
jgi:hypothetical protein